MLTGKPLFPGKNVVHQLDLMTDLLGTSPPETIARVGTPNSKFCPSIKEPFIKFELVFQLGNFCGLLKCCFLIINTIFGLIADSE